MMAEKQSPLNHLSQMSSWSPLPYTSTLYDSSVKPGELSHWASSCTHSSELRANSIYTLHAVLVTLEGWQCLGHAP